MALQDLAAKAEELQEMRISKAAVMESAEKEKETVESLRADVSQLQSDKVMVERSTLPVLWRW